MHLPCSGLIELSLRLVKYYWEKHDNLWSSTSSGPFLLFASFSCSRSAFIIHSPEQLFQTSIIYVIFFSLSRNQFFNPHSFVLCIYIISFVFSSGNFHHKRVEFLSSWTYYREKHCTEYCMPISLWEKTFTPSWKIVLLCLTK